MPVVVMGLSKDFHWEEGLSSVSRAAEQVVVFLDYLASAWDRKPTRLTRSVWMKELEEQDLLAANSSTGQCGCSAWE
ncbi:hypothetical protein [Myxococcus eversor]|uniref:hypothetical protein n=1 Tax=Myxococcus eversor TaxID=2709661 RepID=UPI0013D5CA7E|nr:hypothetical protein [Myxococcus eversor]